MPGFWCQVPGEPRNNKNEYNQQSPIVFNAILGSHCKANIVVRSDSIAIQFLVGFLRRHVGFTQFVFHHLSNLCQPHNQMRPTIASDGGAVGYRPPVQNDYFTTDSESSLFPAYLL